LLVKGQFNARTVLLFHTNKDRLKRTNRKSGRIEKMTRRLGAIRMPWLKDVFP